MGSHRNNSELYPPFWPEDDASRIYDSAEPSPTFGARFIFDEVPIGQLYRSTSTEKSNFILLPPNSFAPDSYIANDRQTGEESVSGNPDPQLSLHDPDEGKDAIDISVEKLSYSTTNLKYQKTKRSQPGTAPKGRAKLSQQSWPNGGPARCSQRIQKRRDEEARESGKVFFNKKNGRPFRFQEFEDKLLLYSVSEIRKFLLKEGVKPDRAWLYTMGVRTRDELKIPAKDLKLAKGWLDKCTNRTLPLLQTVLERLQSLSEDELARVEISVEQSQVRIKGDRARGPPLCETV